MRWRWLVPLLLVTLLGSLPHLIAARPVHADPVSPSVLLARIRASAVVPWSGYGESRGAVALPDVKQLGDVSSLLGTTTRYRVWSRDAEHQRVDALSLTGEKDTARDPDGTWHWDSDAEIAVRVLGAEPVRLPDESDLVAPTLGRRLAGTKDVVLSVLAARRVGGRQVPGVRLTPLHPALSTIRHVDLYAEPRTGLVLEVDVQAGGQRVPVLQSVLLSLSLTRPSLAAASFDPGDHGTTVSGKDLAEQVDQRSPYVLPPTVGGLAMSQLLTRAKGLASYGEGFGQVVLLPLARGQGRDLANSLREVGSRFDTALLHGLLVEDGFRRRYLLVGTVPSATLDAMGQDLLSPPAAREGRPVIRTQALVKRFGGVTAVSGIDLDVREGDRYGFLGPNGSGKTTTVRMLLGLVLPTSGSLEVLGTSTLSKVLPRIGAMVEGPAAIGHLSGRVNLTLLDGAGPDGPRSTRRARVDAVLEQVGLGGVDGRPVKAYSLGMRQRLGLAAALLRTPELLILDEPTNGLDPQGITEIRELLLALNKTGTTVFLSSHLLSEVEALCTRIGVMDRGSLVLQEELSVLTRSTGRVEILTPDGDLAARVVGGIESRNGNHLLVRADSVSDLNASLVQAGVRVDAIGPERRTLEQVVLAATSSGSDRVAG